MLLLKLLYRDIKNGISKQVYKLLPVVVVVIFMFIKWNMYVDYLEKQGCVVRERSFLDCIMFLFEGMAVYKFNPRSFFNPPMLWIVFHTIILYFTAYYPHKDCGGYGKTIFLAGKSRKQWWNSKMVWCALSVVICYAVTYICLIVGTIINGYELSFTIRTDFLILEYGNGIKYFSGADVVAIVILLPVFVSIAICELQMLLSFILTPVISFALMIGLFVVSSFYTVWWLLPNYTMWRRSAYFDFEGLLPSSGIILSTFTLVVVFVAGTTFFRYKDII